MEKLFLRFCYGAAFNGGVSFIVFLIAEVFCSPEVQFRAFLWGILFTLFGGPAFVVQMDGLNLKNIFSKSKAVEDSPEKLEHQSDKSENLS